MYELLLLGSMTKNVVTKVPPPDLNSIVEMVSIPAEGNIYNFLYRAYVTEAYEGGGVLYVDRVNRKYERPVSWSMLVDIKGIDDVQTALQKLKGEASYGSPSFSSLSFDQDPSKIPSSALADTYTTLNFILQVGASLFSCSVEVSQGAKPKCTPK